MELAESTASKHQQTSRAEISLTGVKNTASSGSTPSPTTPEEEHGSIKAPRDGMSWTDSIGDRHRDTDMPKMRTVDELSYSDHKPVCLYLKTKMRKWKVAVKPPPIIKWDAFRQEDKQQKFREKTAELIMNYEIGIERDWDQLSSTLVQVA